MTTKGTELERLHDRIIEAEPQTRHRFQPRLARLIEEMDEAGEPVPVGIRDLSDELMNAAIEAQFDNMPV